MKEKENNLQRKIKIIWKNTLIGSEIPSQTIKSNDISFQKNETIAVDMPDAILTTDTVIEKNNNSVNTTRRYINESEYQLIEELGRGGMGIVYLAQQKSLNREVALKVISTKRQQQEMQKRFISEAIITADLDHPNIVPIHALTKNIEGYTSIAMKRVHGKSWNELLHSKEDAKKLTLLDNLDIFIKVCDAVHYAHSHFIIHRDLKPENIMIGNFGEVFVMDWGIAIDISEKKRKKTIHRSEIKSPEGTPLYMAPEMVLNEVEKLGVATDVYLLGATLYEILHGHPPHKGKSIIEILYYASKESVGNIKDICLSTHYELDNIIIKCLAHDPEDRFQSVASLKNEIQNFVRHYDAARIIEIASDKLNDIEDKLDECNSEDIYLDGDQVYNGFVQALVIHPENEGAKQGAIDVTKIQANWAVKHQELNMLEIYSNRLKKIQPLPKKEIDIIEKKLTTLRNLRKNIVFSFAIIIFIITLVYSVDKWLGKYLKENEDEILQQNKIDNIWSSFRDLQRKYNLKKLFDFTEKNKNKNIDFPTSKLRKSNMLFALQMGYYDDVVLLLAEEIKYYPRIQKKLDYGKILKKLGLSLDENLLIVLNNAKTHKSVLENLCNFASNNYFQGRKIVKIWEEYFSNIKNSSLHEEIKNIGTATILGLAVKQNIINNPKQAQEEIQQALKIDLPVELWNLMTLANKNKKATYPQKNPFIFQLQDERILCTNSKKKTLWSFPPYQIQIMTNFLFFPRKNRVYVGYGRFLLGINVETGSTVERYILPPHIFHLHRIDKKSFAIEVKGFSFRESRTILFNVNKKKIKKDEPVLDTLLTTMQKISETNRAFINEGFDIFRTDFKKNIWHSVNLPLNKFLKIAETLCLKDKTNEVNYYVKALILHEMGSKEQANKIIDLLLRNNQLTFSEHVTLGMYSNFFGIPKWDDLFFDKAKILQVKTFHNPNLDYASVAAIHYLMKKLAEHYFDIGKEENPKMFAKCFLILENIRKLYAFTEGDYYSYLSLHRWALKNNKKELALTFQNLAEKSYDNGGDSFAPEKSIVLADMLIPFVSIVVFLFFALVLYYWYRARQTRIVDLKSVGYGSVVLRNVAFALNPIKRARYTFINYTNVKERVLLFALFTTGIAGMLVFNACIMYIGKLATVPYNLADGYLGTENSIAYLKKLENKVDSLSWNLLMAEARYQKKEYLSAEKHWKKVNQAIAYNNLGCLLSSKDKDEAMRYFEKNILCDSMYSMVAKINISILKKEKLDNDIIKKLPTIYQNHLNILPGKCLLLFCDYKLLQKSQIDETETVFFMLINLFSFSTLFSEIFSISMLDIASGVYYFLYFVMFIMIIGFFSAERKISEISFGMNKTDSFLLLFGHVLPGTIWVVKRQAIRSLGIFTVVIGCYIFLFLHYYDGGILRNIAMPAFPFIQSVADITPSYIYYLNNISVGILFVLFLCSMYVSSLKDVYSRLRQQ